MERGGQRRRRVSGDDLRAQREQDPPEMMRAIRDIPSAAAERDAWLSPPHALTLAQDKLLSSLPVSLLLQQQLVCSWEQQQQQVQQQETREEEEER